MFLLFASQLWDKTEIKGFFFFFLKSSILFFSITELKAILYFPHLTL